jgi:hypothetical protein
MSDELKDASPVPPEQPPKTPNVEGNPECQKPPNPPMVIPAKDGVKDQGGTKSAVKQLTKWEKFERVIRVIEFLALISAIPTAYFIGRQWSEMVSASKIANGQLTVMQGQLDEMKQTRIEDERPWVYVETPDNSLVRSGTNFVLQAQIVSIGKTPAIITGDTVHMAIFTTNNIPPNDGYVVGDFVMLAPNSRAGLASPNIPEFILAQNIPVYIYGTVWYDDISGTHHWVQFCRSIEDGGKSMETIKIHSSSDDIEANKTNKDSIRP